MRRPSFIFKCKIRLAKQESQLGKSKYPAVFRFGKLGLSVFSGSAGKIRNLRAQPDFRQQNRRSRKHKTWVWSADLGFPPHFRNRPSEVCGKFRNPRAHRHFCAKKPQLDALVQLGVVGLFRFCRILPDLMPFILFWRAWALYRSS